MTPAGQTPESSPAAVAQPLGRILVVDDNELNRDLLGRRLVRAGYAVEMAEDGHQALALVREQSFDCLLLDVMMPGISGLEVLQEIRKGFTMSELPVIMATARDGSQNIVEAFSMGANDYVTKPLDFAVVLARMRTQLSLKRATEEISKLNLRLVEAQERIANLMQSSTEAVKDVPAWAHDVSEELTGVLGVPEIGVFSLDGDAIVRLFPGTAPAPGPDDVKALRKNLTFLPRDADTLVPVSGMSGEMLGVLVLVGKGRAFSTDERRLVASFAHQLGGTLELVRTRKELEKARDRKTTTRKGMLDRGVDLASICPVCGACYDQKHTTCRSDGRPLDNSRLLPFRILDRYRLVRLLATGGMGTVFHAYDVKLDRNVAVKILNPEHFGDSAIRMRFEYEARAVARIEHPGVVALFDTGELEDGSMFLVMEKLEGSDLSNLLADYGRGTPKQVARLLRLGAAALSAAHRAGVLHRDVKPENLFLTDAAAGFEVKILDFGVAKQMNLETRLTRTGLIVGTPAYMAPEQVSNLELDVRSDLYSFAAVAYESLVGRRVTQESDLARIFVEVLQVDPPSVSSLVPGVSSTIDAAFRVALAKDPNKRPWDVEKWVESFVADLDAVPATSSGWPFSVGSP
ncbi:MAG: response regulator [Acidobacteria bacterium]|nr:response regulator [Acidobacteriota bacterium]